MQRLSSTAYHSVSTLSQLISQSANLAICNFFFKCLLSGRPIPTRCICDGLCQQLRTKTIKPLDSGRTLVAIPGPSVIPDRILNAMHRPSPDIYSHEFQALATSVLGDLKSVARTNGNVAIYIANGHGAWEATLTNLCSAGDKILVLSTGLFAVGWGGFAEALGVETETIDFGIHSAIDADVVAEKLASDADGEIKAVIAVHVDTASSVRNDISRLGNVMRATGHPALLLVDCIASLACDDFHMDEWNADVVLAGSQKGLMLPPGLAIVYFNKRAHKVGSTANLRTPYWDWSRRIEPDEFYQLFCGTAPTHHIFGLRESLDMILRDEGLEHVLSRHEKLARSVWAAVDAWGKGGSLTCNIPDSINRSHAVTSLCAGPPYGQALRQWTCHNAGVSLGIGLGLSTSDDPNASGSFRIGHMGHINPNMLLSVLASIEAGFQAIGFKRGRGALEAAAAEIAS